MESYDFKFDLTKMLNVQVDFNYLVQAILQITEWIKGNRDEFNQFLVGYEGTLGKISLMEQEI